MAGIRPEQSYRLRDIELQALRMVDEQDFGKPWADARDRPERLAKARIALALRAFREEIAPLMRARQDLFTFSLPVYEFSDTGGKLIMVSDGLTPEARAELAKVDALIKEIAESWGLTLTQPINEGLAA
jgi:hypothetical protein